MYVCTVPTTVPTYNLSPFFYSLSPLFKQKTKQIFKSSARSLHKSLTLPALLLNLVVVYFFSLSLLKDEYYSDYSDDERVDKRNTQASKKELSTAYEIK